MSGVLRATSIFEQGFKKEDVLREIDSLNIRIVQLESELENEKSKSEKLAKELEILKNS